MGRGEEGMGRRVGGGRGEGQDRARGFPRGRDSLLHTVVAVNMETCVYAYVNKLAYDLF